MEKALFKVSSFRLSQKAKKELSSIGDDFNSFTTTVEGGAKWIFNKLKGKTQKPLSELLQDYNLPPGLFPQNATNYDFDEVRAKLTVYIPSVCEVGFKDSSVVRYSTRVSGFLLRGKLTGIEGMKTKIVLWVKVTTISVDGPRSDKVNFTAGVKKSRPRDAYEVLRDGVVVDEF
ncbi:uncharacterized protein At5g01610 [Cryptomeria japonica]|uniref:uncharacterized protein At5g01610 n=1 Tax=Cryptomeria japonica TaxID=3369 RepID=UPI0027DA3F79|nr:uncharacterized protein At5g01610 [Cryptomeria japonica]XP_057815587.2 uncharacterized protein At5g01610 [Cryptomeria japonica]